jgi:hypothetical protein
MALAALVFCAAVTLVCLIPLENVAGVLLGATVLLPSLLLESRAHGGALGALPINGQARAVTILAAIFTARFMLEHGWPRVPGFLVAGAALYLGGLVVSTLTALARGNDYTSLATDLSRQLSYPFAFLVGVAAGVSAGARSGRMQLYRSLAWAGIGGGGLAILYWLWSNGTVPQIPMLGSIFKDAASANTYGANRSIFPFVEDSPNLGAVIFGGIAAFVAPPLLLSRQRSNVRLATALAIAVAAAVLTTESRTGLLLLVAIPLPFLALMPPGRARRRFVIALLLAGVVVFQAYRTFPQERALSTKAQNLIGRQDIWSQAERAFLNHPGFGEGYHYSARFNFIQPVPNPGWGQPSWRYQSVHNQYLGELVDGGVLGGAIFLAFACSLGLLARRLLARADPRSEGVAFLCYLIAIAVAGLANAVLLSPAAATLFWLFTGIAATALNLRPIAEEHS